MNRIVRLFVTQLPVFRAVRRDWPRDTVLKRRRSVLFAFTFSPHATPS